MPFRAQYAYPPAPPGWIDEEFEYYFDVNNTPALATIPALQIPLQLQSDAEYHWRAVEISGNQGNIVMRLWKGATQLSQTLVPVDDAYSSNIAGAFPVPPPIGKLPVILEPEVLCEPGSQLLVDLDLYV